jgi:hypothetical protein
MQVPTHWKMAAKDLGNNESVGYISARRVRAASHGRWIASLTISPAFSPAERASIVENEKNE